MHCFGLAQLHQLRRLAIMAETGDGFRIAEEDLRMRGPGELLGACQAGLPRLRFGDLREHGALLVQARDAAEALLAEGPALARPQHAMTRRVLERRTRDAEIYGPESG